jgi:VWFA-related protein
MFSRPALVLLLLPLLNPHTAPAQQPQLPTHLPQQTNPAVSGDIPLNVQVNAKSGEPIPGLKPADFTLLDNNLPQTISSFRQLSGSQSPVSVILVLDSVNSDYSLMASARIRVESYLRENEGHLAQPTLFLNLTDTGYVGQTTLTTDGNALSKAVESSMLSLRTLNRSTGSVGGSERVELSVNKLHLLVDQLSAFPGRKLILWISPGWPMFSSPEAQSQVSSSERKVLFTNIVGIITAMQKNDVTLYNVNPIGAAEGPFESMHYEEFMTNVSDADHAEIGDLSLQVLAARSGGLVLNDGNDIAAMLRKCVADSQNWYRITFTPTKGEPSSYHKLTIKVDQPKAAVRSQQVYYTHP